MAANSGLVVMEGSFGVLKSSNGGPEQVHIELPLKEVTVILYCLRLIYKAA